MGTFSKLLTICVGTSPVTGEFPEQRPVKRSFDVFWINGWVNNREACDLRRHAPHYAVTIMTWQGSLGITDTGPWRLQNTIKSKPGTHFLGLVFRTMSESKLKWFNHYQGHIKRRWKYCLYHLPRMFLSTDFAFWITDWTCCHGPHLHAILRIISRGVSGLATDSPCGVWGRGWNTCLLHDCPLFGSHFKMRVGM